MGKSNRAVCDDSFGFCLSACYCYHCLHVPDVDTGEGRESLLTILGCMSCAFSKRWPLFKNVS